MSSKSEGGLAIVAALLVLFAAMLDPRISAGAAVVILAAFGAYRLVRKE